MEQTEHTAIVLRCVNYRDHDRMLTLFSPTRGKIEAIARGCRKPRSPLLNASEMFALGDYELAIRNGRSTVASVNMIESFYPLRADWDRLAVGTYCLNIAEACIQPGENAQEMFMLLLHTLSRLTFSEQPWRPLLAGFLLHTANVNGFRPRLHHCIYCGCEVGEEGLFFDVMEGGVACREHARYGQPALAGAQVRWMREMLGKGSATWVDTPESYAPFSLLREYVEKRMDQPIRSASMLPK